MSVIVAFDVAIVQCCIVILTWIIFLDHLVYRETEVKGLVCPECRDEIIDKAKGRFDEKLGI